MSWVGWHGLNELGSDAEEANGKLSVEPAMNQGRQWIVKIMETQHMCKE